MSMTQQVPGATGFDWQADAEQRLRRALVRAGRDDAVLQDQIDCAEMALAVGLRDVAATLYGLVFLQMGFAPRARARQQAIAARTGLWTLPVEVEEVLTATGFSVDRASRNCAS